MMMSTILGKRSEPLGNWNKRLGQLGRSQLIHFLDVECEHEKFLFRSS